MRLLLLSWLKSTVKLHPPNRLSLTEWSSLRETKLDFINVPKTQVLLPNVEYLYFHSHTFWGFFFWEELFPSSPIQNLLYCVSCAILLDIFTIKNMNMEQSLAITLHFKVTSDRKSVLMSCNPHWAIQNDSEN